MNLNRIPGILLSICLMLALNTNRSDFWRKTLAFSPAAAQDASKRDTRSGTSPVGDADQDKPQGRTAISVSVDLITLQVLVTSTKGGVITGLRAENFTVYEDNVKQQITNFSPVDANITVVMLVEYSRQISYFIDEIWNAMSRFVISLRPGDWAAVIGYDLRPRILADFTQDKQKLLDTIRIIALPAMSESNLSDALIDTLDRTQELEGKVAILLLSTGLDTFSKHTYDEALKKCKEANASVYAIGLGQQFRLRAEAYGLLTTEDNLELLMADNRLKSFAEFTGGAAYFPRFESELPTILGNISQMLRSQYSIAYVSSNTNRDGKFRKIRVEVNTNLTENGKPLKLKVVTRKGYIARQD